MWIFEPSQEKARPSDEHTYAIQPLIPDLPFSGVGNSGMGKYHGEWGFRTYTNAPGVLYHGTGIDPDLRYPPYSSPKALRELVAS
jgi:hypothetical protein